MSITGDPLSLVTILMQVFYLFVFFFILYSVIKAAVYAAIMKAKEKDISDDDKLV